MSSLQNFYFSSSNDNWQIRFVGTAEIPEWVGADLIAILYPDVEPKNRTTYLRSVPDEWKGRCKVQTPGGLQEMVTVYESGFYCLIARSNSPLAIPFQKWMYEEVLPTIRRKGSYSFNQPPNPPSLPPAKERLENVRLGMDILYELGGIDERTGLALRDIVRDILLEDKLKKSTLPSQGRAEWPISDRARHLGYNPNRSELIKIGKTAANFFRLRYNDDPVQREQYVDGTTRMVKCYGEEDLDIVDKAILIVMEQRLNPTKEDED